MRTITLKNNDIKKIYNDSPLSSNIINSNSKISQLLISTTTEISLDGIFSTKISLKSKCYIHLNFNFKLLNNTINLINSNSKSTDVMIYGTLNTLTDNLVFNCDSNCSLGLKLNTLDTISPNSLNININSSKNINSNFIYYDFNPPINLLGTPIKSHMFAPNVGRLTIKNNLSSCNFFKCHKINFSLFPPYSIDNLKNISNYTFNSISISNLSIDSLISKVQLNLPITAILYDLPVVNGQSKFKLSKEYVSSPDVIASIMLNNNKEIFFTKNL